MIINAIKGINYSKYMHVIIFLVYFYHFVLFHVMILKYTNLWIIIHN